MDSQTTPLRQPQLQEDRFATIRRRNKWLIIALFILILAVAAVTGGIIVYLIRQHNLMSDPQSATFKPSPGIREYCSGQFNCISLLTHSIQSTPDSTPTQIFRLSLETASISIEKFLPKIPNINPRFQSTAQNCSGWLRHSLSRLNSTINGLEIDPDEQTRMVMLEEVTTVWNDLKQCGEGLISVIVTAAGEEAALYAAMAAEVYDLKSLVGYGGDFLEKFDLVNGDFNYQYAMAVKEELRAVEYLSTVTLYGSSYFVLLFLFCLMLRIY